MFAHIGWTLGRVIVGLVLGAVPAVLLGLAMGLALNDWAGGGVAMAIGIAASEFMFLTKPTDAIDAIRRYRAGDLRWTTARSTSYWIAAPDVAANRVGLRLQLVF